MGQIRIFTLLLILLTAADLYGQTWAQKLGFPPDAKVLILEARELGVTWEFNEAAHSLLETGHATSATVVATGPRFQDVVDWAQDHPNADLGVSIALTNPYKNISWRLMTSEFGPSTLVDADGYPWKSALQVATAASTNDAKAELDAQIRRVRESGIKPTHITGYYGTMFSRADLAAVILGASRKYWLPAPVVDLTPELIARFREEGYPVDEEMVDLIRSYPLPKLDDLQPFPVADTLEEKRELFYEMARSLKPGLTLVVLRPAEMSKGLKKLTPEWQQRVWESAVLRDEKTHTVMKEQKILVTTWREIMERFEGVRPAPANSENEAK